MSDELLELDREEIDRQFAAMAEDLIYQIDQLALAESFAESDWEALNHEALIGNWQLTIDN